MDRDAAAIALVDSNLHREKILPSEKAFAYKLKMEAMKRQGQRTDLTSAQLGRKLETAEMIGEQNGESRNQVRRYIRLTNLIPNILDMVDQGRIALTPAVELSYLTEWEQRDLLETMESEDCTPSLSQAIQMKALSQSGQLDMDKIFSIMTQPKANQQEKISFKVAELRDYFPRHYTAAQMMQEIKMALKERQQRLARQRDRDAR
jgi:ParB family chromosome partitioning protein